MPREIRSSRMRDSRTTEPLHYSIDVDRVGEKHRYQQNTIVPYTRRGFFSKLQQNLPIDPKHEHKYVVNTRLCDNKHITALDLDNEDGLMVALVSLQRRKIDYEVIESSQDRYWLLCNRIGPFADCLELLEVIPGVDENYIKCTAKYEQFYLRAVPKDNLPPRFKTDGNVLKQADPLAYRWFLAFQQHFVEVEHLYKDYALKMAVKNGTIDDYLSNPTTTL